MLKKAKKDMVLYSKNKVKGKFAKNYVFINLEEHFASIFM